MIARPAAAVKPEPGGAKAGAEPIPVARLGRVYARGGGIEPALASPLSYRELAEQTARDVRALSERVAGGGRRGEEEEAA